MYHCLRLPRLKCRKLILLTVALCVLILWMGPFLHERQVQRGEMSLQSLNINLPSMKTMKSTFKNFASNLGTTLDNIKVKNPSATQTSLPVCRIDATQDLVGSRTPSRLSANPDMLISLFPFLQPGGRYSPSDCIPRENMALIIPFRNRHSHLYVLLRTLLPILLAQKLKFSIYVIEQNEPTPFNKGNLYNAGVLEALSREPDLDCFIFHDVDLLPLSDHNIYQCDPTAPLHFVAGVDKWDYGLLYDSLTGGVIAFTKEQYQKVNGFSNLFFGWGSEDDDMTQRIKEKLGDFHRKSLDVGQYDMLKHHRDMGFEMTQSRMALQELNAGKIDDDGLNNVAYRVTKSVQSKLYTWINVDIDMNDVFRNAPKRMKPFLNSALKEYKKVFGKNRVPMDNNL